MARLAAVQGDITRLAVDVIVNAANSSLLGGGGVDGAIHRAAGPGLLAECRSLGGACTGEVKLTSGHRLSARWVAHAVGPVWHGGGQGEAGLLAACYRNALVLAASVAARSIAYPAISTGVYGYPFEPAARIAIATVREFLAAAPTVDEVLFCCFSASDYAVYCEMLAIRLRQEKTR